MNERPSPEDLANKDERDAAYWRERCEALDATLIKAIAWINNQGFMFGCVVEDLNRERLAENITPDPANP